MLILFCTKSLITKWVKKIVNANESQPARKIGCFFAVLDSLLRRVALLSVLAKLNSSTKVHEIFFIWIRAQLEPNWSPLKVDCKQTGSGLEADWKQTWSGLEVDWKQTGSRLEANLKQTGKSPEADQKTGGSKLEWRWIQIGRELWL